jgi:uncharacterized membrane protein YkvA (DUF1232 family)
VKPFRLVYLMRSELPRLLPLVRDGRVPLWSKIIAGLAAALVISPIDLFGDIPVLGLVDDAALLLLIVHLFVAFAEKRARVRSGAIAVAPVRDF